MNDVRNRSLGQSAGSDSANFLMGMLNAYMEDEACY